MKRLIAVSAAVAVLVAAIAAFTAPQDRPSRTYAPSFIPPIPLQPLDLAPTPTPYKICDLANC